MNGYVLDTHIWLWCLSGNVEKIPPKFLSVLNEPKNDLWLSSISVWESIILVEKKRINIKVPLIEPWLREKLIESPLREAPINNEIVFLSRKLKFKHQDPADRFIAATAKVYGCKLITLDSTLLSSKEIECLEV